MYQAGIQNVVSSSGTSLTKDQIKLIRRYTNNVTILYDGDAAGIKASFRGIDLILEEGLNVKVVLFPDGEDPDSYSKKASTEELETYIKEHTQDFISFKSDILLKEGEKDPIKLAELIKDIAHSVALIPDQITRTVYMQQISTRFGISEQVVAGELMKLRKNVVSQQLEQPELREITSPKEAEQLTDLRPNKDRNDIYRDEHGLVRLLVKFGTRLVQIEHMNEQGEKSILETSVVELICHELDKDGLTFTTPLFETIYRLFREGLTENTLLKTSYFKHLEDQDIVRYVTDIESSDHELSAHWINKYNIHTRSESDKLNEAVMNAIYSFKAAKIEQRIDEIRVKLSAEVELEFNDMQDLIAEQILLEKIKLAFSEKLGRIILR